MGKLFGSENFDPRFIITQIFLLQSEFYFLLLTFTFLLNHIFGLRSHIDQILTVKPLEISDSYNLVCILTNLLIVPFLIASTVLIVERTSKCLDFVATVYINHLILLVIYSEFPLSLIWWGINGGSCLIVVLVSEYLCLKIEQQEINLNFSFKKEKV